MPAPIYVAYEAPILHSTLRPFGLNAPWGRAKVPAFVLLRLSTPRQIVGDGGAWSFFKPTG